MKKVIVEIYSVYAGRNESPSVTERFVAIDSYEFRKELVESENLNQNTMFSLEDFLMGRESFFEDFYSSGSWSEPTAFGIQILTYDEYKKRTIEEIEKLKQNLEEVDGMMENV